MGWVVINVSQLRYTYSDARLYSKHHQIQNGVEANRNTVSGTAPSLTIELPTCVAIAVLALFSIRIPSLVNHPALDYVPYPLP